MTRSPASPSSSLGAAHGIAPRPPAGSPPAARACRFVGLGDLEAVAADCPGSVSFEADVHRPRTRSTPPSRAPSRRSAGIDTLFANAGIGAPGFLRTQAPEEYERVIEVNWSASGGRSAPACRTSSRAAVHPARRVDGRDPAAGGAHRVRRGEGGGREHGRRAARRDAAPRVGVGVAYFSWIDTEMVRGADRTALGAHAREIRGPLAKTTRSPPRPRPVVAGSSTATTHRRLPALADPANVAQACSRS
jgi:hypothetical protein